MDPISFTFLAYASFCLARVVLRGRGGRAVLAVTSGVLMMLLDVVIDPVAVRGDRWFLGHLFYYPDGGPYFGVPVSNFVGWAIVGFIGVGTYLVLGGNSHQKAGEDRDGRRVAPGVALYYAVLSLNFIITAWIGEWMLLAAGIAIHTAWGGAVLVLVTRARRDRRGKRGVQTA
jgi:uncharacterized membrane protein